MEMFDVHRRDLFDFDEFMNLKNPGFGGPKSAIAERDAKGNRIKKEIKLEGYRNVVERHPAFTHQVWDSTYKAMGGDLVHKQEVGHNPYDYPDPYENMGIPVVEVGERETTNESSVLSYDDYMSLNENEMAPAMPREREREREVEIERPDRGREQEGDRPNRPPRRRVDPAPKNLVQQLAMELDITEEEAEWLLSDDDTPMNPMDYEGDMGSSYDYDFEEGYEDDGFYANESFGHMAGGLAASAMRSRSRMNQDSARRRRRRLLYDDQTQEEREPEVSLHDIAMDNFGCEFWEIENDDDKKWALAEYSRINQSGESEDDDFSIGAMGESGCGCNP